MNDSSYFLLLVFVFLFSVDDACPDSTITTSDVTTEGTMGTNNVTVESAVASADVSEVCEKGESGVVPESDAKLSLRMNPVTPANDGSEESLPFSLESKRMKPEMYRPYLISAPAQNLSVAFPKTVSESL